MKLAPNFEGIGKLIKWGIPILGLMIGGPIGMIAGLFIAACVCVKDNTTKE